MLIPAPRRGGRALVGFSVIGILAGCSTAPPSTEPRYSTERHYETACDSASRDIDILMVHWGNIRPGEPMPEFQVTQARQAIRVIQPVCDNIGLVQTLDSVSLARVQAAFRTLEQAARNLPRLPAGA